MRKYTDKKNVQKKSYYNDRFYIAPTLPKTDVSEDAVFAADLAHLSSSFEILESYIQADQMVIYINPNDLKALMRVMKEELHFENLSEMSAIDFIADRGGFELFYQMLSMAKRKRVRIKTFISQKEPIDSLYSLYKSADWAERECFDMFGIRFNGHPYMKRILMPDDWFGHPLLKTYPLHGDEAAAWYEVDKIFGKEYRDVIGPENRDSARVDRYDTERFSRIKHEVPFGAPYSETPTENDYQEDGGIPIVRRLTKDNVVQLKARK
jgi:NADH-quinone oxidoreductase subunit C